MRDLFGQVVVTYEEIDAWVAAVAPGFATNAARRDYYVRAWNVVEKIQLAKISGTFHSTIENARARRAFLARRFGMLPMP